MLFKERNTNILIYVKRRLGMCSRKLGKLKEAAKIFRDVTILIACEMVHSNPLGTTYSDTFPNLNKYSSIITLYYFIIILNIFW